VAPLRKHSKQRMSTKNG